MREIKFNVYQFDELSDEAKKKAIETCKPSVADLANQFDSDEFRSTLSEIEKLFDISVNVWQIGPYCRPSFRFRFTLERWRQNEEEPKMLVRYLNEVLPYLKYAKRSYYKHGKHRTSRVLYEEQYDYCVSGTWCDAAVDDALNNMWEAFRKGLSCRDFVEDMLCNFFNKWQRALEDSWDDDYVAEHLNENGDEFLEDGTPYNR